MRLLDRQKSTALARPVIEIAEPVLVEVLDDASNLLEKTLQVVASADEETFDSRIGVISAYRHLIEMVDGAQVLISSAAPIPSRLPLRAGLESLLTIAYILSSDSKRRALAWVVCALREQARLAEMFDPHTDRGKDFLRDYKADRLVGQRVPEARDSKKDVSRIQDKLSKPYLVEAAAEYEKLRKGTGKSKGRIPEWYSFHGGPKNLRELAVRVDLGGMYGVLYRVWSETAHGRELYRQFQSTKIGTVVVRLLRDPSEGASVASHALSFLIEATRQVINAYHPENRAAWSKWYMARIRAPYTTLSGHGAPRP